MKKFTIAFVVLLGFIALLVNSFSNKSVAKQVANFYLPPEQSREELFHDIYISLLMPYIQKEINSYYSKILKAPPEVAPYTVYVLSAERPNAYRTFFFRLKLKVIPYVGAHNSIGIDNITFIINGIGEVKTEKFEHIKSYNLPPEYQYLFIQNNNQQER